MVGLGDLSGGAYESTAFDVTDDGSVVVGRASTSEGLQAFIWDTEDGMRLLQDFLSAEQRSQHRFAW